MAHAIRFNDRRRTKYKMNNHVSHTPGVSLAEHFLNEINQRPQHKYDQGAIVYTKKGYRQVQAKWYNSISGWMYQFSERRYTYNLAEIELTPLFFCVNEYLMLPSNVIKKLTSIRLSANQQPILVFEIQPKQFSVYSYLEILDLNPPDDTHLLQFVWGRLQRNW